MDQLWTAYDRWKVLSEREGLAIREANWAEVRRTQDEKRSLQTRIVHLTDQINAHLKSSPDEERFDSRLRSIVNELILLETENNLTLEASITRNTEQRRSLDATSNRLRQLHSRYVPNPHPVWQNVS